MASATLEVMMIVDGAGDYGVGKTKEEAQTSYEENIQPLADADGLRYVTTKVTVPLPTGIELEGEVEEEADEPGKLEVVS